MASTGDLFARLFLLRRMASTSSWIIGRSTLEALTKLCEDGRLDEALETAEAVQHQGIFITRNHAYSLLQECEKTKRLESAKRVNRLMIYNGLDTISVLGDYLVRLLAYGGCLIEANKVVHRILGPSLYTWGAIISANVKLGEAHMALDLYHKLQQSGLHTNEHVYVAALKSSIIVLGLAQCRAIHDQIMTAGIQLGIILASTLLDAYAKCGNLEEAECVFSRMLDKNTVTWNAMISGYAHHGDGHLAIQCFEHMQKEGVLPNAIIFSSVLQACGNAGALRQGVLIHDHILQSKLEVDVVLETSLIDMYAKCGNLEEARKVFDMSKDRKITSWNAMLTGYSQHNDGSAVLECFEDMQHEGIIPSQVTFLSLLKAYGSVGEVQQGRLIHDQIIQRRLESHVVLGGALVDMYAKCGNLQEACNLLESLPNQNVISWGALISGLSHHGNVVLALECFCRMQQRGINPNEVLFLAIIKACYNILAIQQGRLIHAEIIKNRFQSDLQIGSALLEMYAKCGSLGEAQNVFTNMARHNVVSWNTIISAHAQHGNGLVALQRFEEMQQNAIKPNEMTFNSVFPACSNAGLVDEGRWYFNFMKEFHGIAPSSFHYASMVDLLGHVGCLFEAEDLLKTSVETNIPAWRSLLNACSMYTNVEIGKKCFDEIISRDFHCDSAYVLMLNIYANACMRQDSSEAFLWRLRKATKST